MHNRSLQVSWKRTLVLLLIGVLYHSAAIAQTKEARLNPTKDQILARAKQEGKLSLVPGYDKSTIGPLVAAFTKKYPFIDVSWQMVTGIAASQRQLFELAAGKAAVDVFSPSTAFTSEYFKQDLIMKYDLKGMAKSAQLQNSRRDDR